VLKIYIISSILRLSCDIPYFLWFLFSNPSILETYHVSAYSLRSVVLTTESVPFNKNNSVYYKYSWGWSFRFWKNFIFLLIQNNAVISILVYILYITYSGVAWLQTFRFN
jgi:hypothetical protein